MYSFCLSFFQRKEIYKIHSCHCMQWWSVLTAVQYPIIWIYHSLFIFMLVDIWGVYCFGIAYLLSHVQLFVTPWTVAHQVPLSMGFSKQEYWSGLPFPPPGESSWPRDPTVSLGSPALADGSLPLRHPGLKKHRSQNCDYQIYYYI